MGVYVGRFIVVAPGRAGYRVSSRSFPNRTIVSSAPGVLAVVPTDEAEATTNPYVSYECLIVLEDNDEIVLGNGNHVRPVATKRARGVPIRDALAAVLLGTDYEDDAYDTPRIAGIVGTERASVGIVRADGLHVEAVTEPTLVATYERDRPAPYDLDATTGPEIARELMEASFEHPVCAAGTTVSEEGIELAVSTDP